MLVQNANEHIAMNVVVADRLRRENIMRIEFDLLAAPLRPDVRKAVGLIDMKKHDPTSRRKQEGQLRQLRLIPPRGSRVLARLQKQGAEVMSAQRFVMEDQAPDRHEYCDACMTVPKHAPIIRRRRYLVLVRRLGYNVANVIP